MNREDLHYMDEDYDVPRMKQEHRELIKEWKDNLGPVWYKPAIPELSIVSGGVKYDQEKPPIGLIPTRALVEEAKVMGFGAEKYGEKHQWRKGMSWQRLVNALLRHTIAYNEGELLDPETVISHMAHVRCCAAFLLEYEVTHPELNDLYQRNTP